MVITPDIPEYRKFQITAAPITQISFWLKQARSLPGGKEVRTIGLGGISFSGTIALITAARPEIRNEIGFVIAVGPYSNLLRCIKSWFAPDPTAVDKETYPTRFYAKWIIMLSALDMIAEEKDRLLLTQTLNALLLQKKMLPDAGDASPQGKRWYDFAVMHENQSDPELTEKIENHLIESIYPTLEPAPFLKNIGCPVFLIHGAYDDLIPSEESVELHQRIPNSYLLISPFLSHTHPIDAALGTWKKLSAVFETLIFSYRFSRQIIE
jgi:pimeloyl-ACP methyl ester carboxylesterase